ESHDAVGLGHVGEMQAQFLLRQRRALLLHVFEQAEAEISLHPGWNADPVVAPLDSLQLFAHSAARDAAARSRSGIGHLADEEIGLIERVRHRAQQFEARRKTRIVDAYEIAQQEEVE